MTGRAQRVGEGTYALGQALGMVEEDDISHGWHNATVSDPESRPWHLALAYAVSGQRLEGLGTQSRPDPVALGAELTSRAAATELTLRRGAVADIPADLRVGLGAAQLAAALAGLHRALALDSPRPMVVGADRPLDAEERRLSADVPPHHHAR